MSCAFYSGPKVSRSARTARGCARRLSRTDYARPDPVWHARNLLGKYLMVHGSDGITGGIITETEAYGGAQDKACHGYNNRRTARTEIMFGPGGFAYVYLCYGLHHLFNVVVGRRDCPQAVLIRAVYIVEGQALVAARRKGVPRQDWASGPGKVCAALGITRAHGGVDLAVPGPVWIEDRGLRVPKKEITVTPRIGVDYAGAWAKKPWRFVWDFNHVKQLLSYSLLSNING